MNSLSDEERARIVFLENIGDEDETTINSQLGAYGNILKVQFWTSVQGNNHAFVTYQWPKSATQALESAPSNDKIDFTVRPVIETSLKRYQLPGKERRKRSAAQAPRPPLKDGLPAKPMAPLGTSYHAHSISSDSSIEGGPLPSSLESSLRQALSAMQDENRMLNNELRYIKESHESTLVALNTANADLGRLQDERRVLEGKLETAIQDADHYNGRLRHSEDKLDRCIAIESDLKRRLNLANQAVDSYRKQVPLKNQVIADYKTRLSIAERRLREADKARLHIEEGELTEPEVVKPHNDASITKSSTETQMDVDRLQAVAPILTEAFVLLDKITSDMLKQSGTDGMKLDGPMRKKRKLDE